MDLIIAHHGDERIRSQLADIITGFGASRAFVNYTRDQSIRVSESGDFLGYSDTEFYRRNGEEYTFLDAATQMDEIRSFFNQPPQLMPTPTPAPAIRDCIVIVDANENLINTVNQITRSIDGRAYQAVPAERTRCFCVSINNMHTGFSADLGEWYAHNAPWSAMPQFDVRTEAGMNAFKTHLGLIHGGLAVPIPAQAAPVERPVPTQPTPGNALIKVATPELSREVQEILFEAGHQWSIYGGRATYTDRPVIIAGSYIGGDRHTMIRYTNNIEEGVLRHPLWPVFDAATQMSEIRKYFGVKRRKPVIENMVKPGLLSLIRNTPGDDMVAGFIRRDLQLVLPQEVQDQGSAAIIKWLLETKYGPEALKDQEGDEPVAVATVASPPPVVAEPPAEVEEMHVEFSYRNRVRATNWVRRTDRLDAEVTVPEEVVREALAARDFEIILSWIRRNIDEVSEVDRSYGDDEDITDSEITEEVFSEFDDIEDARSQFNRMLGQ